MRLRTRRSCCSSLTAWSCACACRRCRPCSSGACSVMRRHMAGKRSRGVERDQALRAVAEGVDACPHCRPDTELGVLD
ncbi:DUF6233 domain-containing protein [Streptomyces sp. NPDC048527]|uniref:DUF6233 domain-containing protein n=1 Tax=Streptomyces sp. NPDC048527 TaxID=3365568 RepID=UPI0037138559